MADEDKIKINPYRPWLYFGCANGRKGHYLHDHTMMGYNPRNKHIPRLLERYQYFDGFLLPETDSNPPYTVYLTLFEAYDYTAFAFWDFTVDTRGGSNSLFWCPVTGVNARNLWRQIKLVFPKSLIDRFPELNFGASHYKAASVSMDDIRELPDAPLEEDPANYRRPGYGDDSL